MTKLTHDRQDNWKRFDYNSRYLDAVASLFHIQGACAATMEYCNKIYLSYSAEGTSSTKKAIKFIEKFIQEIRQYEPEDLLGIYLIFNVDCADIVKKNRTHIDEKKGLDLLENFINIRGKVGKSLESSIAKIISTEDLKKFYTVPIVKAYKEIIQYFFIEKNAKDKLDSTIFFLRPVQDSYKFYDHLSKTKNKFEIELVGNPNLIHADCNIINYFPITNQLTKKYVGVSRLCCGYCHEYLDIHNSLHRGTHGVSDLKWHIVSPQNDLFKNSISSIREFDQENAPIQYRSISTDDFENLINPFGHAPSLQQIKNDLNLIGSEFLL